MLRYAHNPIDIKPENILLDGNGNLKLADFGLATLFHFNGQYKPSTKVCGSPPYVAPEVIKRNYRADIVDIWSAGVVLFVLLAGNTPWDEPTESSWEYMEFVKTKGRPDYEPWPDLPADVLSLLRGILRIDPKKRYGFEDIRRHPWFTRANPYMTDDGLCQDGVNLATKLLESLHIDFSKDAQGKKKRGKELEQPEKDAIAPPRLSSTQPVAPLSDTRFEWDSERTYHISSQPAHIPEGFDSQELWASLADDPTMSQFAAEPQLPISRTQNARRFNDMFPSQRLTKFYSTFSFRQILPILSSALHRLGVRISPFKERDYASENRETWIAVKTEDGRRCPLRGDIIVERMALDMLQVTFSKNVGDPVEWRRFFKNVAILSKEAVYTGDGK